MNLPIFGNSFNEIDFSVQEDRKLSLRKLSAPAFHFATGKLPLRSTLGRYKSMLRPSPFTFRAYFLDTRGVLLFHEPLDGSYKVGDFFYFNVNHWLETREIPLQDGNLILVSSHGRSDRWQSSPGNISLRVSGAGHVAGFRTGFFARSLNAGHKHVGFTGLNPRVEINQKWISSLILINHSSEPSYDNFVCPTVRLHRNKSEFMEASFGKIPPHAYLEKSLLDLFPDAENFLENYGGIGYSVTSLKGASLASLHALRSPKGDLLALEHSRPAHTNIISYL